MRLATYFLQVYLYSKEKKKRDGVEQKWVWVPKRSKLAEEFTTATIASLVVRNGWEGIVYSSALCRDVAGKNLATLGDLVCAALENRKYNMAHMLLRMLNGMMSTGNA